MISLNNDPTEELGSLHAGGQAKYIVELGKNLLFHNFKILLITLGDGIKGTHHEIAPGFDVYRVMRMDGRPYGYDFKVSEISSIFDQCKQLIATFESNITVIFSFYWISGLLGLKLKNHLSVPHVIKFCSLGLYKQSAMEQADLTERVSSERHICHNCEAIVATTNVEKRTLVEQYGAPEEIVRVIAGGIDLTLFNTR